LSKFSHPRWSILKRELSSLSKEKTIILALAIQLVIAGFSSFLVVGLTALYDPASAGGDELTVGIAGETQDQLLAVAMNRDDIEPRPYVNEAAAMDAFERGEVDAVVTGTVLTDEAQTVQLDVVVPAEDLRTTLIVTTLREYLTAVETIERQERAQELSFTPIELPEDTGEGSPYFGFTYTILIPLLLFLPPFISGSIAVDSMTEELERGTLELLRVAPLSVVDVVDGKALGMIGIAPLQALLWMGLLRVNGIGISNGGALTVVVTAIATLTVVIGLLLALLTRQRRQAQLLYSIVVLLLFGLAVALPEHPASTVAKLAIDSATVGTFAHVALLFGVAVAGYLFLRRYATGVNPERL